MALNWSKRGGETLKTKWEFWRTAGSRGVFSEWEENLLEN